MKIFFCIADDHTTEDQLVPGIWITQIIVDQILNFVQLVDRGIAVHEHLSACFADASVIDQEAEKRIAQITVECTVITGQC